MQFFFGPSRKCVYGFWICRTNKHPQTLITSQRWKKESWAPPSTGHDPRHVARPPLVLPWPYDLASSAAGTPTHTHAYAHTHTHTHAHTHTRTHTHTHTHTPLSTHLKTRSQTLGFLLPSTLLSQLPDNENIESSFYGVTEAFVWLKNICILHAPIMVLSDPRQTDQSCARLCAVYGTMQRRSRPLTVFVPTVYSWWEYYIRAWSLLQKRHDYTLKNNVSLPSSSL